MEQYPILIITEDSELKELLVNVLDRLGFKASIACSCLELTSDYALIIAGPDQPGCILQERLQSIAGIPPAVLYLRYAGLSDAPEFNCCRCKILDLPMDILKLKEALEQITVIDM